MIKKGALAKHSQRKMLLGALPRDLGAKAVMKLDLDPRDLSTFKFDKLQHHVLDTCATADALPACDWEGARMAPGVSPYSIPAGISLPQMPVVMILLAICNKETPPPVQAMEEIPIAKAENTKMDNMIKPSET
jgi:hypothetical protein